MINDLWKIYRETSVPCVMQCDSSIKRYLEQKLIHMMVINNTKIYGNISFDLFKISTSCTVTSKSKIHSVSFLKKRLLVDKRSSFATKSNFRLEAFSFGAAKNHDDCFIITLFSLHEEKKKNKKSRRKLKKLRVEQRPCWNGIKSSKKVRGR